VAAAALIIRSSFDSPPQLIMSTFCSNERSGTPLQASGLSRSNTGTNLTGSPSQEGLGLSESGDEKDNEIARLKCAYHDAVMDNNKKASTKTNT
jgi:hypothetical protein